MARTSTAVLSLILASGMGLAASQNARQPLASADAAMKAGRFAEAATQYQAWLKMHPDPKTPRTKDVMLALGICQLQLGRSSEAVSTLKKHVQLAPESALGHSALGIALLDGADLQSAKEHLRTALGLDPAQNDAAEALARIALSENDSAEAVRLMAPSCAAAAPTTSCVPRRDADEVYVLLAEALLRQGNATTALRMLEQRIQAHPESSAAVYASATQAAIGINDLPRAAAVAEQGMRRYPDSEIEGIYLSLPGPLLAERVGKRIAQIEQAPEVNEMVALSRVMIDADPEEHTRAPEIARRMLADALKIDPGSASARYHYGRSLERKDRAAALRQWQAALAMHPSDELKLLIYTRIGMANADSRQLAAADAAFRSAHTINQRLVPRRPDAALEYVTFLRSQSRTREAAELLQQIMGWNPLYPKAYVERAKLAAVSQQWPQVVKDAEFALRNASRDIDVARASHSLLARAYNHLGQPEKAQESAAWLQDHR